MGTSPHERQLSYSDPQWRNQKYGVPQAQPGVQICSRDRYIRMTPGCLKVEEWPFPVMIKVRLLRFWAI